MQAFQEICGHVAHVYLLHVLLTIMRLQNPWLTQLAISQLIEDFIHVVCDVEINQGQPSLVLRPDYAFFQVLAQARGNSELDI
jgi:DNA-binding FadR family transcriptional regulator